MEYNRYAAVTVLACTTIGCAMTYSMLRPGTSFPPVGRALVTFTCT